jgi:basic amino acid/polyamine antiporter, APA family
MAEKKPIGIWIATSLVIGNMVGAGVYLLPATLAPFGPLGIIAWGLTAIGAMCLAVVFAKLGHIFPKTGGPYAYCNSAFGDFIGFQTAWAYWVAAWIGNAALALACVSYMTVFWPELKTNPMLSFGVSLAILWFLTWVNVKGVKQAGIIQLVTSVLKLLPLFFLVVVGIFYIDPANFEVLNPTTESNFSILTAAATLTLWSFIGVESATIPADHVVNPKRTIPIATILGTSIAAVIYIIAMIAVMGILPMDQLKDSAAPFADAAAAIFGSWAGTVIAISAIISAFGALNGWVLLQGQVPMAAARDGVFPKVFAKMNKNDTPAFGLIISSILISILMYFNFEESLVDQFTFVILLATLNVLIPYLYSSFAGILLFLQNPKEFSKKTLTIYVTVGVIAALYSLWAIYGSGRDMVFYGSFVLFGGIPVYVWMRSKQ